MGKINFMFINHPDGSLHTVECNRFALTKVGSHYFYFIEYIDHNNVSKEWALVSYVDGCWQISFDFSNLRYKTLNENVVEEYDPKYLGTCLYSEPIRRQVQKVSKSSLTVLVPTRNGQIVRRDESVIYTPELPLPKVPPKRKKGQPKDTTITVYIVLPTNPLIGDEELLDEKSRKIYEQKRLKISKGIIYSETQFSGSGARFNIIDIYKDEASDIERHLTKHKDESVIKDLRIDDIRYKFVTCPSLNKYVTYLQAQELYFLPPAITNRMSTEDIDASRLSLAGRSPENLLSDCEVFVRKETSSDSKTQLIQNGFDGIYVMNMLTNDFNLKLYDGLWSDFPRLSTSKKYSYEKQ